MTSIASWGPVARFRAFRGTPRGRFVLPAIVLALVLSYPWWPVYPIGLDTVIVMAVYVMLALGLNIVVGYAGLLDLGYVAFFAIGAYTLAWFGSGLFDGVTFHFLSTAATQEIPGLHLSFWIVIPLAGLITAIFGVIIGWPTLRLRGDYLAIVTLGFGEIIPDIFRNGDAFSVPVGIQGPPPFIDFDTVNLTNGVRGVTQLDRPGFGDNLSSATGGLLPERFSSLELTPWYLLIVALVLFTIFVNLRLRDSKMGRAWIAVREDEVAASAMGVPLMRTKLWAYGIGAVFGGFAGAYYGSFINGIFPTSFSFQISVIVLVMVIVVGMGNVWGVIVGALAITWLNLEGLDRIGDAINDILGIASDDWSIDVPKYKLAIFGSMLVLMMLFRPGGLIPSERRKAEFEDEEPGDTPLYDVQHEAGT